MVVHQQHRPLDISLLVRDSLKSFNKLKCSIDDIGAEVRPFYEKNLHVDGSNSAEQLYSSVLKYHSPKSINGCYGIAQDPNLHQLDTFKHQNERYLDELIEYLMKTNNNVTDTKQNANELMTMVDKSHRSDLTDLVESVLECAITPNSVGAKMSGAPYPNHSILSQAHLNRPFTDATATTNAIIEGVPGRDKQWEKFKSDFVSKNSEYYLIQTNPIVSKSTEHSFMNNSLTMGSRVRKIDISQNSRFISRDVASNKRPGLSTHPSVQLTKIDINVSNSHSIVFKKENHVCNAASLNLSTLEFLYIEQIILFNNLTKSTQTNLFIIDSYQNVVMPRSNWPGNKLVGDIFDEDHASNIVPYATFVAMHFGGGYVETDTMLVDNWNLLGSQLALMKPIAKEEAAQFRQSPQFMEIIIETSWNHLCLKEKRRLMRSVQKQYSIEDTVDIIYCYYCNKDKFYPSECSSMKEGTLWKCIFSSIRCGDLRAAAVFAEGLHLENVVFSQYINAFANNNLENLKELRDALLELYTFEDDSKLTIKRLVFSLLLNLDDIDLSIYFQNFDDLLWFKFSKAYFFKATPLDSIRCDINEMFVSRVRDGDSMVPTDPLAVVQALLYCGDYVGCVSYLGDFPALSSHMVNLAIAMYTEGVISLKDSSLDEMSAVTGRIDDQPSSHCINLKDIFLRHIQKLSDINVDLAVEYIYAIKDFSNDLVVSYMTQISQTTSNISRLFGNILPDGSHTDCLLNLFENDSNKVLNHVARNFEKNNDLYRAIRIYDISQNYKKVVKLINKMLCETICLSSTDKKRTKIFETSNFIFNRMVEQNWSIDLSQRSLFEFLHDYLWLENLMETNDIVSTLRVAEDCRFIPTNNESLYDFQKLIKNLPPIAFKFFGNFIRSVATLFYHQYVATVDPLTTFCFNNQDPSYIKNKMKCLVKMVTQMCTDSIIPSDAMQAVLLIDNKMSA